MLLFYNAKKERKKHNYIYPCCYCCCDKVKWESIETIWGKIQDGASGRCCRSVLLFGKGENKNNRFECRFEWDMLILDLNCSVRSWTPSNVCTYATGRLETHVMRLYPDRNAFKGKYFAHCTTVYSLIGFFRYFSYFHISIFNFSEPTLRLYILMTPVN